MRFDPGEGWYPEKPHRLIIPPFSMCSNRLAWRD